MANRNCKVLSVMGLLLSLIVVPVSTLPQSVAEKRHGSTKAREVEALGPDRRIFAISLVTSLAEEARNYKDQALGSRVIARAADTLWNADKDTARLLFRRAWEIAEKVDTEQSTSKANASLPPMVVALRSISGRDQRLEVLRLAARRDRALGEEFLSKLKEKTEREVEDLKTSRPQSAGDSWSTSDAASKRLQLARRLLDDGDIQRALEFAEPALGTVNANSILFLSKLREKRPEAADQKFAFLLAAAELDPASDANTVSGLSSYVFTPGLYVTFSADGHVRWSQPEETSAPPNLPAALRTRFFQAAASMLLRPLPPPDQDFTSSGRTGKYMVINRLLPLFDQYAPDTASALRPLLRALAGDGPRPGLGDNTPLLTQGLRPAEPAGNELVSMQNRLDHAKTSQERDKIYSDAAVVLANQGDVRAQDIANRIDDPERRVQVRQYVDLEFVKLAIRKKDDSEIVRIAKVGQFTHVQRVWAYTQAARLLIKSDRLRNQELLAEAADEARRISADDPDRARALTAVATQFAFSDRVRAWEIMAEAANAANSVETFSGENVQLTFGLIATKSGVRMIGIQVDDFGLAGVLRTLARDDLYRSVDLAKSFKRAAPRATATMAVANAVLEN